MVNIGRNKVGRGRNKVGRGGKGPVEVENDQVEPGRGRKYPHVPTPMLTHMKMQVENLALANSRFVFHQVLFLYINFHKLKLTQGSSYLPLPDWILSKKAVINPKNEKDEECFK